MTLKNKKEEEQGCCELTISGLGQEKLDQEVNVAWKLLPCHDDSLNTKSIAIQEVFDFLNLHNTDEEL